MKHLLKIFITALIIMVSTNVYAQVTTSSMTGKVTDEKSKEALIGAAVIAKHIPTGTEYTAVTNDSGAYNIQGMIPGGPYTVKVTYLGYQTKIFNNITLSLGESENLNVWLKDDYQSINQVVITADKDAVFNAQKTGAATSFNLKKISQTPSISRSLFDIAKLTPQAKSQGSGTSFAGSSNKYNSFQIDGTVNNDVFGLSASGTNGGQTGANPISLEAIQAVQVVIAPFDVRQSGFTGGSVNAITKSGTNELKGSAYSYYNNQDFFGTTPGPIAKGKKRTKLDKQTDQTYGFTLGGPIVKDKLFFFINGEYNDRVYPLTYTVGNGSAISEEIAKQIEDKMKELSGGYNGGGFGHKDVPTRSYKGLARIDWNIAAGHRLSVRYSYLNASKLVLSNSPKKLSFNDAGYVIKDRTHSVVAELNSQISNSVSNEFRVGYTRVRDHRELPGKPFPRVTVDIDNNRSVYLGSEPYSMANRLDQDIITLTDNLTYSVGNHIFTFGTHNEFFNIENLYIKDLYGTYLYSLDSFLKIGTPQEVAPSKFEYSYSVVPNKPFFAPQFSTLQTGFYLQDDWNVTNNFKLTYGLRMDVPFFFNRPTENKKFNESELAKKYNVANNTIPSTTVLFSPRVGFRYSPLSNRRLIIRGGMGIFTGRIPFVWISNSFSNTGMDFARTKVTNKTGNSNIKFMKDISSLRGLKVETTDLALVTKNFRFPQIARFNLALDFFLPGGVKGTLEGMYSKNINNINYKNLAIRQKDEPLIQGPYKRPVYEKVTNDYISIIQLGNTDKGYSYNVTAQLQKSFKCGLDLSLAYTYGHSYAVNDGLSSQAYSNWQYNLNYYGDAKDELFLSRFDLGHRIVGGLTYHVEYAKHFGTTIGLIYNGQTGDRFSMVYSYSDINGDGSDANDLAYIPTKNEIAEMNMSKEEQRKNLSDFVEKNPQIKSYEGKYIPRNGLVTPFVNQVDLHIAQDFYIRVAGRKHTLQLNADIQNLGNMLNRNWGLSYDVRYNTISPIRNKNGKYSFSPLNELWNLSVINSRWRAQVGVKYIF